VTDPRATSLRPSKPIPLPDPDTVPYWDGLRRHELCLQQCAECNRLRWPARLLCDRCQARAAEWVVLSGQGELVTWSVMHHVLSPAFADDTPYVIGMVRLAEQRDLIIMGPVTACSPGDLRIGVGVQAAYADIADGVTILQWAPTALAHLGRGPRLAMPGLAGVSRLGVLGSVKAAPVTGRG